MEHPEVAQSGVLRQYEKELPGLSSKPSHETSSDLLACDLDGELPLSDARLDRLEVLIRSRTSRGNYLLIPIDYIPDLEVQHR